MSGIRHGVVYLTLSRLTFPMSFRCGKFITPSFSTITTVQNSGPYTWRMTLRSEKGLSNFQSTPPNFYWHLKRLRITIHRQEDSIDCPGRHEVPPKYLPSFHTPEHRWWQLLSQPASPPLHRFQTMPLYFLRRLFKVPHLSVLHCHHQHEQITMSLTQTGYFRSKTGKIRQDLLLCLEWDHWL